MADKQLIGIRYCGGCNPRYDRVALAKRFASLFPELSFVSAQSGVAYAAAIVVCGCGTRCAETADLAISSGRMVWLSGWEDLLPAKAALTQILSAPLAEAGALSREEVLAILPQRPPMLFVDTVSRLVPGQEAVAQFYVSPHLPAFAGHFPGEPVLPGVFSVEACAQTADILLMTTDFGRGKTPLFAGIRKASFRERILPGDTMEIHAELLRLREAFGSAECRCQVFVNGKLAADAEVHLVMR